MTVEGNVGADHSLLLSAADAASANARAAQGGSNSPVFATNAAPQGAHYAGPSGLVMAAALVLVGASGLFTVSFDFYFTDSASDTVSVAVAQVSAATAISGGSQVEGWFVDEGSNVVVTGGGSATIETLTKTVTTGALTAAINASFISAGTPGSQVAIKLLVSATHTLSAMTLNATALQIG
jgi:hypothetical protein